MCRHAMLFLLPLGCAGSSFSGEDVAKNDLKSFQGSWQPVLVRNPDGQLASDEELKAARLVIKGNEFTLTNKELSISGTFTIDPSKTPKTIDFLLTNSKSSDEKFLGVYAFQGDRRFSCFALPKQSRPRELRPAEKGYLMFEWKPATR